MWIVMHTKLGTCYGPFDKEGDALRYGASQWKHSFMVTKVITPEI